MNYYTCPMHPEVHSDKSGICSQCGMALLRGQGTEDREQKNTHIRPPSSVIRHPNRHEGHRTGDFLVKFWASLILTIPVVVYSELPERVLGVRAPAFPGSGYLGLILGSIVFFYGGWVFLASAVRELRAKLPGMMTLIALAITAAYLYSVYVVLATPGAHTLFWELTTLITVMLLGHWLEMRAVQGAQGALRELAQLLPDTAERIIKRRANSNQQIGEIKTEKVQLAELRVGDWVLVRPGGRIAADGVVIDGASDVDEALVTGESRPVGKKEGSEVIAGTVNGDGPLTVKITKIGENTFLAGIMRLVADAQASKSRLQLLSDQAAFALTIIAVVVGIATFGYWLATASAATGIERAVAVLVITCPHALGLAIPLVASISTTLAARNGFLVRNRLALEAARVVDVVLFDKTGTLTTGRYGVTDIIQNSNIKNQNDRLKFKIDENEILRLAAAVDQKSEHFIARAIVRAARERKLAIPPVAEFKRIPGAGVSGLVKGQKIFVGGEAILATVHPKGDDLATASIELRSWVDGRAARGGSTSPIKLRSWLDGRGREGKTVIYVVAHGRLLGALACADVIREESREAVSRLHQLGVSVAMVTGDSEPVAAWVARELGIKEVFARVLPDRKAEIVRRLQNPKSEARNPKQIQNRKNSDTKLFRYSKFDIQNFDKRSVAFVGDGINDAPALVQADVGIAIGAGTNVAIESAGIILVRDDPRDIPKVIALSRATYGKMLQNLFWATGYNVAAIPLAAGVLAAQGIVLQPAVSALLMSVSTVIVAFNAVLLRKIRL